MIGTQHRAIIACWLENQTKVVQEWHKLSGPIKPTSWISTGIWRMMGIRERALAQGLSDRVAAQQLTHLEVPIPPLALTPHFSTGRRLTKKFSL